MAEKPLPCECGAAPEIWRAYANRLWLARCSATCSIETARPMTAPTKREVTARWNRRAASKRDG